MAYSGNEISYMDYRSQKIYNNYGSYNYGSAAYELDFQRKLKEEKRKELEEERRKKQAAKGKGRKTYKLDAFGSACSGRRAVFFPAVC